MSEKIKTYHLVILDKSGSMNHVRQVTLDGLNEQIQSARQSQTDLEDQEQIICLTTFNAQVDSNLRWNVSIDDVQDFVEEDYVPMGGTALNDAICLSINKLKEEIEEELYNRKANVMVTILTDGHENASTQFSASQAKELVEEVKATGRWTVSFIGCGDDVFETAASYGISHGNTLSFAAGAAGTQNAFTTLANSRSVRNAAYSEVYTSNMGEDEKAAAASCLNSDASFFNLDIPSETEVEKEKKKKKEKK